MPIYEKSVRPLLKDFVTTQKVANGQVISKEQVFSWFRSNYSKIKMSTVAAHLIEMSVSA